MIHYYDIGDYLNREEKLSIINKFKSVSNPLINWETLHPNDYGDWISQRNDAFGEFISIQPGKKFEINSKSFFTTFALGIVTLTCGMGL